MHFRRNFFAFLTVVFLAVIAGVTISRSVQSPIVHRTLAGPLGGEGSSLSSSAESMSSSSSDEGGGPTCGDGVCDGGEDCASCETDCEPCGEGVCGDGTVDPGEECDDGNMEDGDGCSSTCADESGFCGDGMCTGGEDCVSCETDCGSCGGSGGVCGDGAVDPGEECDDGNTEDGDGCSSTCTEEDICDAIPGPDHLRYTLPAWNVGPLGCDPSDYCSTGVDDCALFPIDGSYTESHPFTVPSGTCEITIEGGVDDMAIMKLDGEVVVDSGDLRSCRGNFGGCAAAVGAGAHTLTVEAFDTGQVATLIELSATFDCVAEEPVCGDSSCDAGESCETCTADCGICLPRCGDGACTPGAGESCTQCPSDCGQCPVFCGDHSCNGAEKCSTCSADCGSCPATPATPTTEPDIPSPDVPLGGVSLAVCGDGMCNGIEGCGFCEEDCGACTAYCGNGVCDAAVGEDPGTCPGDCGIRVPVCGNDACDGAETCGNCTDDCGACTGGLVVECGDGRCAPFKEDCGTCAADCGSCSAMAGVLGERKTAEDVREAARALLAFLGTPGNTSIQDSLSSKDVALIESLTAIQEFRFSDQYDASRVSVKLHDVVEEENIAAVQSLRVLTGNAAMRTLVWPYLSGEFLQALSEDDLQEAAALLWEPARSLPEAASALDAFVALLGPELPPVAEPEGGLLEILSKVFAQENLDATTDAEQEFMDALELMQAMTANAQDPDSALPRLEDELAYLISRKNVIGGIVRLKPDALEGKLQEVQEGMDEPSTSSLLKLTGILQYIRSTANFEALEDSFTSAATRMRSGIANIRSLFARGVSPRVEAASVLGRELSASAVTAFENETDTVDAERSVVLELLEKERKALEPLLAMLEGAERTQMEERIAQWERNRLSAATNPTELRQAMEELYEIVDDLEEAAREQRNVFFRIVYALQDFFGRST